MIPPINNFIHRSKIELMINRRSFLKLSVTPVALPILLNACVKEDPRFEKSLSYPVVLGQLCDSATLHEIGLRYRKEHADEDNKKTLRRLILRDYNGMATVENNDPAVVLNHLRGKMEDDFRAGRVTKIDGWILSVTEARQCALFSIAR